MVFNFQILTRKFPALKAQTGFRIGRYLVHGFSNGIIFGHLPALSPWLCC
jgi:hypothetical protein